MPLRRWLPTRVLALFAMTWLIASQAAAQGLEGGRGYVCPMPGGGAWASTVSFPGCQPATNFGAAEREVARINAAINADGSPRYGPAATGRPSANEGPLPQQAEPSSSNPIYRCSDGTGRTIYTDVPCSESVKKSQPPAASQQGGAQPSAVRAEYDRVVTELEGRYPVLNPDSPTYDHALAQRVVRQMQVFIQRGYSPVTALRAAVNDVMVAARSVAAAEAPRVAQAPAAQTPIRGGGSIFEASAKGLVVGLAYAALGIAGVFVWWLIRRSRAAARAAAFGVARAVGSASARVDSKVAPAVDAFKQLRRPDRHRDKSPWK